MLVLLCDGVFLINSLCGRPSLGTLDNFSNMLDLASHKALVTGEWYIPGHKLIGFRIEEPASIGGELSCGEFTVETTGIGLEAEEERESVESNDLGNGSDGLDEKNLD